MTKRGVEGDENLTEVPPTESLPQSEEKEKVIKVMKGNSLALTFRPSPREVSMARITPLMLLPQNHHPSFSSWEIVVTVTPIK